VDGKQGVEQINGLLVSSGLQKAIRIIERSVFIGRRVDHGE